MGMIAYLSAFDGDAAQIERQRERVSPFVAASDGVYVVDDAWPDAEAVCPPSLFRILRASRMRMVEVVAVETISRFARNRTTACRIATILCDAGVQIREADRDIRSGEHGTGTTPRPSHAGRRGRRGRRMDEPALDLGDG